MLNSASHHRRAINNGAEEISTHPQRQSQDLKWGEGGQIFNILEDYLLYKALFNYKFFKIV